MFVHTEKYDSCIHKIWFHHHKEAIDMWQVLVYQGSSISHNEGQYILDSTEENVLLILCMDHKHNMGQVLYCVETSAVWEHCSAFSNVRVKFDHGGTQHSSILGRYLTYSRRIVHFWRILRNCILWFVLEGYSRGVHRTEKSYCDGKWFCSDDWQCFENFAYCNYVARNFAETEDQIDILGSSCC